MKISNTSNRLKEIMVSQNLKQIDILEKAKPFCNQFNIKLGKSDLSQFVSGKVEPGSSKLGILAMALNVNEAWLMGYDVPMERTDNATNGNSIYSIPNIIPLPETELVPLIGTIACGTPITAVENIAEYLKVEKQYHADFALTCQGDSMINARIFDGDIVFIKEQPMVENGEIAAVLIDDEATLKRVYRYKNSIQLRAENPMYPPLEYEKEEMNRVRILGKAVAFSSIVR